MAAAAIVLAVAACAPSLAEHRPLTLLDRTLLQEDSLERLYRLRLVDPAQDTLLAFVRRPVVPSPDPGGYPGIVLVAGRETGRRAAQVIPRPLDGVVLAVEYPEAIPMELSPWGLLRRLPSIRRSAYQMPGLLVGAAEFLARDPGVDSARLALVGVSFGVPFAAAAGPNPIFRGVALHHGGADLSLLFRANLPIENALARGAAAQLAAWYFRHLEPARHVGRISPRPLLLINGLYDTLVPRASALRLAAAAEPPVVQIWLPHDHLMPGDLAVMRELADSTIRHLPFLRAGGSGAPMRTIGPAPGRAASGGVLFAGGVVGGVLGGAIGALAGHLGGQAADCFELDCRDWWLLGAAAGESIGLPTAVHIANGREGRLLPSLAVSVALGAAGYALVSGTDLPDAASGAIIVAVPIAQLLASVSLERR